MFIADSDHRHCHYKSTLTDSSTKPDIYRANDNDQQIRPKQFRQN